MATRRRHGSTSCFLGPRTAPRSRCRDAGTGSSAPAAVGEHPCMTDQRVSASRRINASAHALFEIVASPEGHVRIDGSGMLEAAADAKPLVAIGDVFDMEMDRTPLNDIPGLVKYKVRNTVTQIVPDQLVEWTIGGVDQPPLGHVYGWQLDAVSANETDVTNYCDWSNITVGAARTAPRLADRAGRDARAVGGQARRDRHGRVTIEPAATPPNRADPRRRGLGGGRGRAGLRRRSSGGPSPTNPRRSTTHPPCCPTARPARSSVRTRSTTPAPARSLGVCTPRRTPRGGDRRVGRRRHADRDPPPGGWPVIAWAHGTTGVDRRCACRRWTLPRGGSEPRAPSTTS